MGAVDKAKAELAIIRRDMAALCGPLGESGDTDPCAACKSKDFWRGLAWGAGGLLGLSLLYDVTLRVIYR